MVRGWVGTIPTCLGPTSSRRSPTGHRRVASPTSGQVTGMTARPGPVSGGSTGHRPKRSADGDVCPTPNCTATPTSRSSTGRPTLRNWWPRPPDSDSKRSPSATTTASTASSASPRRPGPSSCRRSSAPNSHCHRRSPPSAPTTICRAPGRPIPPAITCSCWPATPVVTRCWHGPSARVSWLGARGRPSSPTTASSNWAGRARAITG